MKFLSICATLAITSGCCSTPLGMPEGPDIRPLPLTSEEWKELKPELREVLNHNGLEWAHFYDRVKERHGNR